MKRLLFIFNPYAGRRRIASKLNEIVDSFVKRGYLVTVYPTQSSGDATNLLIQNEEIYDMVLCAGGDGTLNEVVNGMMRREHKMPIGYIPVGSVNDVAHSLNISRNIMNAVQMIQKEEYYSVDVGKFNDRYFSYVAAFGALTDISYTTPSKNKNIMGSVAYFLEGIKKLSEVKPRHVRVSYNDVEIEEDFIVGLVTNSLYIGGFKNLLAERTSLCDGIFEVLLIKMPKNIIELETIVTALVSEKLNDTFMYYFRTSSLTIHSRTMEWTLDGEFGGNHKNVEIVNCRQAIQIAGDNKELKCEL